MKRLLNFIKNIKYGTIVRDETRMLYLRDHPEVAKNEKSPKKRRSVDSND